MIVVSDRQLKIGAKESQDLQLLQLLSCSLQELVFRPTNPNIIELQMRCLGLAIGNFLSVKFQCFCVVHSHHFCKSLLKNGCLQMFFQILEDREDLLLHRTLQEIHILPEQISRWLMWKLNS